MERGHHALGFRGASLYHSFKFRGSYSVEQSNNDDSKTVPFSIDAPGIQEIVDIAVLNSRIKFDNTDVPFDQRVILGDATETGLTRFAGRWLDSDYDERIRNHPKVFEGSDTIAVVHISSSNPFNSTIQFHEQMGTGHRESSRAFLLSCFISDVPSFTMPILRVI
jgi:hypothetical protein